MRVVRRLTYSELQVMRSGPVPADDPYLSQARPDHIPYKRVFEAHDAQTRALIGQYEALARFPHSETIVDRLEHWRWLDTMAGAEDKHQFLEPLIAAVQRDPVAHEDKLIFLLIICEPVRRNVSKAFVRARQGLDVAENTSLPASWHRREESRRLWEVEREALYDVTRAALLDALYRYPIGGVERFFPWLRATIAHGALDHLRQELRGCPRFRRTLNGGPPASSAPVGSVRGANQVREDRRNRHEQRTCEQGRHGLGGVGESAACGDSAGAG